MLSYYTDLNIPTTPYTRIVIIGGGFGGIQLVKRLTQNKQVQIVLLDKNNYHTFQPLLYQVATGALEPDTVVEPLRDILHQYPHFYFRHAKVLQIQAEKNKIITSSGALTYNYLVLANGAKTNYFYNESISQYSLPMKDLSDAIKLRQKVLQNLEKIIIARNQSTLSLLQNFVVVGGGPTGVEIAGALGELRKNVLPHQYPEIDTAQMQIILIEGTDRVLNTMSKRSSQKTFRYLQTLGVKVILNKFVKSYNGKIVVLDDQSTLQSNNLIWAAGVKGNIIVGLQEKSIKKGRVLVNNYSQVEGYKNIFAIGDVALMVDERYPQGYPMIAPVAMQQGKLLAQNLLHLLENKTLKKFKYFDKGMMAIVSENKAVVDLPIKGLGFGGFFAWLAWLVVHMLFVQGKRNRLVILSNWLWSYCTKNKGMKGIMK